MAKSDFLENEIIKHIFRTGSFTKPTALYVALFTAAPSDAGGGTEVTTSATNYARVDHPPLDANWAATSGTDGKTSNATAITFGVPSGNWGQVTHFALFSAVTGGNMLYWGALTDPKNVNTGDPAPVFPIGSLQITEG